MKIKTVFTVILLVSLFALSGVYAQEGSFDGVAWEEMTQEQYNAFLATYQQRLEAAQGGIDQENATIDELNKELDNLQKEIDATWDGLYATASSDEATYNSYGESLSGIQADANAMLNLTPEEIYTKMNEVDELQAKLDEAKKDAYSATSEHAQKVDAIQRTIDDIRRKGEAAVPPSYTVNRGDYLWKIAGKEDIYANPFAWIRIYTANKDQIKNPDLIYPEQVFSIPRVVGPNEHLVKKGESLTTIAGEHGSPFTWQKIYEANKSVISDPNVIYPLQVLKLQ